MGASVTVYCLEMLTDYLEFERLCHDIMALEGYGSIEPLGGFNDKGRDAIHVDRSNRTTIFAYSVREDWQVKLWEDARKIQKHGHSCYRLVFSTTAVFSAGERDEAIELTKDEFGWELELYGIERLRVLLDAQYPHLKHSHPHIFPTQLLALQSRSQSLSDQDHLFISYASEDSVLAGWLAQRLTAEGYRVWCEQFDLLGGETYPDDIDEAIRNQTFRVLALYSQASLKRPEIARQRALALSIASERDNDFLIPLQLEEIPPDHLDQVTRRLNFIPFEDNWAKGLGQLLNKLQSIDCPKPVYNGKNIAAGVFLEKDVICEEPEMLLSNCLEVVDIPKAIHASDQNVDLHARTRKYLNSHGLIGG
ncbi:MAG: TIR domain-containing protein [Anaerolineae bacterium]